MKKKLIMSIISFFLCFLIFITFAFAWLVLGDRNEAGGTNTNIDKKTCLETLYTYDNDAWVESNGDIVINEFVPGDVRFFKLVITNNMDDLINIRVRLGEYSTSVSDDIHYDNANKYVYVTDLALNNLPLYNADINDLVIVNDSTLYDCSSGDVLLNDIKIENAIVISILTTNDIPSLTGETELDSLDSDLLNNVELDPAESNTLYFAIKFPEVSAEIDSLYQFQVLTIKDLTISIS